MNKIYLNVGCGTVKLPGFVNADLLPDADLQLDVREGLPFENNSVSGIYCEHFIEHLGQGDATAFLRECRRVLVPRGILRVSTPDLDVVIEEYQSGNWRQPWMDKYNHEWIVNRAESLNVQMREWGHQWLFNEEELTRLGEFAGFGISVRSALNCSQDPMLSDLETRPESTLIIEFVKSVEFLGDNPLVSVVMPAYKPQYFAEALSSAIAQTYENLEILVLDDSSDTRIESIVQAHEDSRSIRYFRNSPRLGEIASLTKGINEARGVLIKPLYDDDVLEASCVSRLVGAMQACPDVSLVTSRRRLIDAQGYELGDAKYSLPLVDVDSEIDGVSLVHQVLSTGLNRIGEPSTVLFRRDHALQIRPVVMSLSGISVNGVGDLALYLNLLSRGNAVYLTDRLSRFRLHEEQTQRDPVVREQTPANWAFLRKHSHRLGLYNPRKLEPLWVRPLWQSTWSHVRSIPGEEASAKTRVVVYSSVPEQSASAQLRLLLPFGYFAGAVEIIWASRRVVGEQIIFNDLSLLATADLIVIQRYLTLEPDEVERIFKSGCPVVYEMDEFFTADPWENSRYAATDQDQRHLVSLIDRCAAVMVPTVALSDAIQARINTAQVYVLPNFISFDWIKCTPVIHDGPVRVALTGLSMQQADHDVVEQALDRVLAKYPRKVLLVFIGETPLHWRNHRAVTSLAFVDDYRTYVEALPRFEFDIALVPLADTPYNRCKSDMRWLEYSAAGVAGIYSDLTPYQFVRHGETGLKVTNSPQAWFDAICDLIEHPEKRLSLARAAHVEVLEQRAGALGAKAYAKAYGEILKVNLLPEDGELPVQEQTGVPPEDLYQYWQASHNYRNHDVLWIAERMETLGKKVRFHLAILVPEGSINSLANNIKSLGHQFYQDWTLSVIAATPAMADLQGVSSINWIQAAPEHQITALNQVLLDAPADWVGMFEAGDKLAPHALFSFAEKISRHPEWSVVYSDEDSVDSHDNHASPFFKTDFNLEMLRSAPFVVGGLMLVKRSLLVDLGGFDPHTEGVEYCDLALRAWERVGSEGIGHISDILYHRYDMGGHCNRTGEEIAAIHRQVVATHLERCGLHAGLVDGFLPGTLHVRYSVSGNPLVSILVPTKNQVEMLRRCLTSLIEGTGYSNCEVLVLDNDSDDAEAIQFLEELRGLDSERVRVFSCPGQFNFAAINNLGAREARGEYLVLLNNDTAILHEEWLEEMLGIAQQPDVGAVGAKLFFPDGTIQHAGVILGMNASLAYHPFIDQPSDWDGYFGRAKLTQEFSAVTAACMLVKRNLYLEVGGLDEDRFQVLYNDVDFCLRLRHKGYRNVFTPHAKLLHEGSVSQKSAIADQPIDATEARFNSEQDAFYASWRHDIAFDPAFNRNLSAHARDFLVEIAPALTWDPDWHPRPRVLAHPGDRFGCGEYRIIAPMRALNDAGLVMGWQTGNYLSGPELLRMEPESIILQRQVSPDQIGLIEGYIRRSKALVVFEIDDLITNVPVKSAHKKRIVEQKDLHKRFRKAISLCDRFVVSTEFLAEQYRGYSDDIVVVQNYIERQRWSELRPIRRHSAKARVGWAGGSSHDGDLAIIADVVKATAQDVDWVFFGMCPDSIRPYVAEFYSGVVLDEYPAKLASLDLDLAVAPLEDVPFNHGKSHLRLLEYGVLGFPVICTDITPYRGGYPVTRVPNKFKDWVEAIRSHVADRDELARRGDSLRDYIEANWMLEDHLDVWAKAWLP